MKKLAWIAWLNSAYAQDFTYPQRVVGDWIGTLIYSATASDHFVLDPTVKHELPDGTISWTQPGDLSTHAYNGRCGETAAANVASMLGQEISPQDVARITSDVTPGTLPSTLYNYVRDHVPGTWKKGVSSSSEAVKHLELLLHNGRHRAANDRSPIIALLQTQGRSLHWVTVVDVENRQTVVINQYGRQDRMSLSSFVKAWGFRNSGLSERSALAITCCQPYTVIYQGE